MFSTTDTIVAIATPPGRGGLGVVRVSGPTAHIELAGSVPAGTALGTEVFVRIQYSQIDEAVFVLAELLNVKHEALDYLEKHQRFKQAAELALGWDMPAEVIVRLYCMADDWQRARGTR